MSVAPVHSGKHWLESMCEKIGLTHGDHFSMCTDDTPDKREYETCACSSNQAHAYIHRYTLSNSRYKTHTQPCMLKIICNMCRHINVLHEWWIIDYNSDYLCPIIYQIDWLYSEGEPPWIRQVCVLIKNNWLSISICMNIIILMFDQNIIFCLALFECHEVISMYLRIN